MHCKTRLSVVCQDCEFGGVARCLWSVLTIMR